jgi:UDP-glucose-4-epimerase GalE
MARLMVTGGAGYVGSHCARHLAALGHEIVVVDDLSTGHPEAAVGRLVELDLRDEAGLASVLADGIDAVLHFAARTMVGESVSDPLRYYDINVRGTIGLLQAMKRTNVRRIVFSSSCAVYGVPDAVPIVEDNPFRPISPYGASKAVIDQLLTDLRRTGEVASFALRYFNAAGAASDGWLGESHQPETHLIPIALAAAAHGRTMTVNGTDFPTRDGTCERDYVHVEDLADAHARAVELLLDGHPGDAINIGSGRGDSVADVLRAVEGATGREIPKRFGARRIGDPPALVARPDRARDVLGWEAALGLERIVADAWRWYQHPRFGPNPPC